jgi:hypothetical protein
MFKLFFVGDVIKDNILVILAYSFVMCPIEGCS